MNSKMNHKSNLLYVGNKLSHHGFTPGVIETLGPLLEKEGYKVFYAGIYKSQLIRLIEIILKVAYYGRKTGYILIDTYSTNAFWFAYLAALAARAIKVPYVPILHGGGLPGRLAGSQRACKRLFKHSYANVAVSGYLKHEFDEREYRVIVIPNSIDIKKYPFKIREQCGPRLLWVRSFHRQYNPNMAADVLKELIKTYPEARLCMVGPDKDGSMEEFRNYVAEKGLADQVTITGKLSKKDWIDLSSDYDFFINTTNVDNTPVSVIEAMALGMCVVSTNPGGIPFLLSKDVDSGLVDINDASGMANLINALICSPERSRQYSTQARKKAETFDSGLVMDLWKGLLA